MSAWTFDVRRPVETLHAHQFALLAAALALVLGLSLRAFLTSPLRREGMRIEAETAGCGLWTWSTTGISGAAVALS